MVSLAECRLSVAFIVFGLYFHHWQGRGSHQVPVGGAREGYFSALSHSVCLCLVWVEGAGFSTFRVTDFCAFSVFLRPPSDSQGLYMT